MKRRLSYSVAAVALLALGAAACSSSASSGSGANSGSATGKPLTIVTTELSPMTDNFNPYNQTGTGYEMHAVDLYDLPLMVFNTQNPTSQPIPVGARGCWRRRRERR